MPLRQLKGGLLFFCRAKRIERKCIERNGEIVRESHERKVPHRGYRLAQELGTGIGDLSDTDRVLLGLNWKAAKIA